MTRNEEAIRRLARRAGVSVDELLEAARRPEFNETMAAAIETTTDVWLDAAEKADRGVQQADDPAVAQLFREQAEECRALARKYLGRVADVTAEEAN